MTTQDESQPTSIEFWAELFVRYVNEGNLAGIVNLFESDSVFIDREGKTASGVDAIREVYQNLLALTPDFHIQPSIATIYAGDIALDIGDWYFTGVAPDGSKTSSNGRSYSVFRHHADGTWKLVIDNPFSYGAVPPLQE
jgi:uncharacterized protein (TIGR02246 family)